MKKGKQEMENWEKHYLEHKDKSVDEIRSEQIQSLEETLLSLKSHFPPVFLSAVKKAEGEKLDESEQSQLNNFKDVKELSNRIRGLRKVFKSDYYHVIDKIIGENVLKRKEQYEEVFEEVHTDDGAEFSDETQSIDASSQSRKLPKGFAKWDLKQIKLHESEPDNEDVKWTEYWTLKGETAIGEILFNQYKSVYYFRPHDTEKNSTFALTSDKGRQLTREARNYYFKRSSMVPE